MPAYNDTPQATQQINQTQAPIRTNFQSIMSLIDVNHIDFSDPINFGKHNFVTLVAQGSAPVTTAPDFNIFNAISVLTSRNEVFFNTSTSQVPVTAGDTATVGTTGFRSGWTMLPSGFMLKWGQTGTLALGTNNFSFPVTDAGAAPIPAFSTACVGALAVANGLSGGGQCIITVLSVTNTVISLRNQTVSGATATTAFYFAIGY